MFRVVQVRSSDEMALVVVEGDLDLGSGQTGENEEQAKPCFHRALSSRLGQFESAPKADVPREPLVHLKPGDEVAHFEKPLMQRSVERGDCFHQWETST